MTSCDKTLVSSTCDVIYTWPLKYGIYCEENVLNYTWFGNTYKYDFNVLERFHFNTSNNSMCDKNCLLLTFMIKIVFGRSILNVLSVNK